MREHLTKVSKSDLARIHVPVRPVRYGSSRFALLNQALHASRCRASSGETEQLGDTRDAVVTATGLALAIHSQNPNPFGGCVC